MKCDSHRLERRTIAAAEAFSDPLRQFRYAWRRGKTGMREPARTGILTHVLLRTAGHWLIVNSQNTDIVKSNS
jgi:hypothetical protein